MMPNFYFHSYIYQRIKLTTQRSCMSPKVEMSASIPSRTSLRSLSFLLPLLIHGLVWCMCCRCIIDYPSKWIRSCGESTSNRASCVHSIKIMSLETDDNKVCCFSNTTPQYIPEDFSSIYYNYKWFFYSNRTARLILVVGILPDIQTSLIERVGQVIFWYIGVVRNNYILLLILYVLYKGAQLRALKIWEIMGVASIILANERAFSSLALYGLYHVLKHLFAAEILPSIT